MNTEAEVQGQATNLAPVFKEAGVDRVWLVVGYSGDNAPVFNHLAQITYFKNCLFWIGYRDSEPAAHVREQLLAKKGKYAFFVRGHDAESFFIKIAQGLDCFPPKVFKEPASYLADLKDTVLPFPLSGENGAISMTTEIEKLIALAQPGSTGSRSEPKSQGLLDVQARTALAAGKYGDVIRLYQTAAPEIAATLADSAAWAWVMQGNAFYGQARSKTGAEADRLLAEAGAKYAEAVKGKPDMHEAWYNWGIALADQAKTKTGPEADRLFAEASAKCEQALKLKPESHEAWSNWGAVFLFRAEAASGAEAERRLTEAESRLQKAEALKPGSGSYNLACVAALRGQEAECERWLRAAGERCLLPRRSHVLDDRDLRRYQDSPWFEDILELCPA